MRRYAEETEVPDLPAGRPCENPGKAFLPGAPPESELWVPQDCGKCAPCQARRVIERRSMAQLIGRQVSGIPAR